MLPTTDNPSKLLLVEGKNDRIFVESLLGKRNSRLAFSIVSKGGLTQLVDSIGAEMRVSERSAIGIMVDANSNVNSRWQSIRDRIRSADPDIVLPNTPARDGTVINGFIRVGIWLMPDNGSQGQLEDFLKTMIRHDDPVWPLAERFIKGIPREYRRFGEAKVLRAKLHAWLATREDPRLPGTAIWAGDLDAESEPADSLIRWMNRLFS